MRRLLIGSVLAALLAAALAAATTRGRTTLQDMAQGWQRQATLLYHEGWVAAAWPVENGLRQAFHQGALFTLPLRRTAGAGSRTARTSPGNAPIGWDAWLRP